MSFELCYWMLMLFWLVFGVWSNWPATGQPANYKFAGETLLLFVLLLLLGWKTFGAPLHQ